MIYRLTLQNSRTVHIATRCEVVVDSTWSMRWAIGKHITDIVSWVNDHPGIVIEITGQGFRIPKQVTA